MFEQVAADTFLLTRGPLDNTSVLVLGQLPLCMLLKGKNLWKPLDEVEQLLHRDHSPYALPYYF
jgi:hypothetical protein